MTIELPESLTKQLGLTDIKLYYNQEGQASEVLISYEAFQEIITLLKELVKPIPTENSTVSMTTPEANQETEPVNRPRPHFGSGKHLNIVMADDFDEPLEDFAEYM